MLNLYLGSLGVGGTLVLLTLLMGGQGDTDFESDVPDMDADANVGFADAIEAWLPLASFRFWTFFLAFFGLAGLLLTKTGALSAGFAPWVAGGVGYIAGASMTRVIASLRYDKVDSQLTTSDWIGEHASVVIPLSKGQIGKIRMRLKGRELEVEALSETSLQMNETVVVYDVTPEGYAKVEATRKLVE